MQNTVEPPGRKIPSRTPGNLGGKDAGIASWLSPYQLSCLTTQLGSDMHLMLKSVGIRPVGPSLIG